MRALPNTRRPPCRQTNTNNTNNTNERTRHRCGCSRESCTRECVWKSFRLAVRYSSYSLRIRATNIRTRSGANVYLFFFAVASLLCLWVCFIYLCEVKHFFREFRDDSVACLMNGKVLLAPVSNVGADGVCCVKLMRVGCRVGGDRISGIRIYFIRSVRGVFCVACCTSC